MNIKVKEILKKLPKSPGIYQFFNKSWKIIYIWKSVNLKSRVNSYFNGKSKLNFAKQKMVDLIENIEIIITENETESLILETNMIKENLPKYNILMKDGKNHNYIKITKEDFPKVIRTRTKFWEWEFYWPYISSNDTDNVLKVLKKVFGYWVWDNNYFKRENSYNLDKYLFKWWEISWNLETQKREYNSTLDKIRWFLRWNYKEVIEELRDKMLEYANEHEFERADIIKKQIESIEIINEKQVVREWVLWDFDVINFIQKFDKTYIWKIEIRNSRVLWFYPFEIENILDEEIEVILTKFIKDSSLNSVLWDPDGKKPVIITNKKIILEENIFSKIKIENPKIWSKVDLLKMCYKNIYEYAYKKHIDSLSTKGFSKANMQNLLKILWYKEINKSIIFECNDISHISWNHTVASRSIIENGKSETSKYKKYKIKTLEEQKIDDFNSMREVMTRRIKEIQKLNNIPDLIIIDGWKWQLSSVVEILEKNNLEIQVVWIAKREEELFLPHASDPIVLDKESSELRLVQKIRDEAHRFAITFNRDSRIKAMKKNVLESLPGFWLVSRKKILKKYWSVEKLKEVDKKELEMILNKNQIETLEDHWLI